MRRRVFDKIYVFVCCLGNSPTPVSVFSFLYLLNLTKITYHVLKTSSGPKKTTHQRENRDTHLHGLCGDKLNKEFYEIDKEEEQETEKLFR